MTSKYGEMEFSEHTSAMRSVPFRRHLSAALLPALVVEKCAILALPGEWLVANFHVIRHRPRLRMRVLDEKDILRTGQDTNRAGDKNRELHPLPHLIELLSLRLVSAFFNLFLESDTSTELGDNLLLHLFLGCRAGNGHGIALLGSLHCPGPDSAGGNGPCGELVIVIPILGGKNTKIVSKGIRTK